MNGVSLTQKPKRFTLCYKDAFAVFWLKNRDQSGHVRAINISVSAMIVYALLPGAMAYLESSHSCTALCPNRRGRQRRDSSSEGSEGGLVHRVPPHPCGLPGSLQPSQRSCVSFLETSGDEAGTLVSMDIVMYLAINQALYILYFIDSLNDLMTILITIVILSLLLFLHMKNWAEGKERGLKSHHLLWALVSLTPQLIVSASHMTL